MRIFNFFKKKKIIQNNLVNMIDLINLVNKDDLNEEQLIKLDSYLKKYIGILNEKDYSNKLLNIENDIKKELDNYNKILNDHLNNEEGDSLALINQDTLEYTKPYRLKVYSVYLMALKEDITLSILALKEILDKRKTFILKRKKNSILNTLNNLNSQLIITRNYITSINIYLNNLNLNKVSFNEEYLKVRYEQLDNLNIFFKLNYSYDNNKSLLLNVVLLERKLELFALANSSKIKEIKNKHEYNNEYENWLLLGSLFPSLLVNSEELEDFYKLKFNIITRDYLNEPIKINVSRLVEKYAYEDAISDRIQYIVKNIKNSNIRNYLNKLFKNDDNIYDYERILNDSTLLWALMLFDKDDTYANFINNTMISSEELLLHWWEISQIKLQEYIPLSTFLYLTKKVYHLSSATIINSLEDWDRKSYERRRIVYELFGYYDYKPRLILPGVCAIKDNYDSNFHKYHLQELKENKNNTLVVPSEFEYLNVSVDIGLEKYDTIVFQDALNSKIVNDEKLFKEFLCNFKFYKHEKKIIPYIYIRDQLYVYKNNKELFSNLKTIVFKLNDNNTIYVDIANCNASINKIYKKCLYQLSPYINKERVLVK